MATESISEKNDAVVFTAASALGIIAGLRSMMAPAVVGYIAGAGCVTSRPDEFGVFGNSTVQKVVYGLAAAEALADKLPFMPPRTSPVALAGRLLTGAVCGATICSAMKRSKVVGAIAGTFGAVGATFAAYQIRAAISQEMGVPDQAIALIEDATAIWTGKAICQGLGRTERMEAA